MNFILASIVFLGHGIVFAGNEKTCGKAWVPLSVETTVQNGKLFELRKSGSGQPDRVFVKDFQEKIIDEIHLPREIDYVRTMESAGNSLIYSVKEKLYHFDPATKREQEIFQNAKNIVLCEGGEKTSVAVSCGSESAANKIAYDFKTQKQIDVSDLKHLQVRAQMALYPEDLGSSDSFSKISLYDFSSSKKISLEVPRSKNLRFISDDHIQVTGDDPNFKHATHFVRINNHWTKISDTKERVLSGILSNGEMMFVNIKHRNGLDVVISEATFRDFEFTTEVYDKTGTQRRKSVNGYYMGDPNGGKAIRKFEFPIKVTTLTENSFRDIANGKEVQSHLIADSYQPASESGKWGLKFNSSEDETRLINLATGQSFKLPYMSSGTILEAESGDNVAISSSGAGTYVVNTQSGKVRTFASSTGDLKFDRNFTNWFQSRDGLETVKDVCFSSEIKVIDDSCKCLFRNADQATVARDQNLESIKDIAMQAMCQNGYFDATAWDKITPPITKGEISNAQAQLYLKRFQKVQGFNPKIHLEILTGILRSSLVENSPSLVNEALKSIATTQPNLIRQFYNVLKIDKRMPNFTPDASFVCRADYENSYLANKMQNLKYKTSNSERKTTVEDWLDYKPFKAEFQKLPAEQRDAIVDAIAESLSQNAAVSSDLNGLFQSKLYYFSKKFALDLVGDKAKSATDLAVAIRNGKNIPIILGSGELQDANRPKIEDSTGGPSAFGFSYRMLDPIALPEGAKVGETLLKKMNWNYEGSPYTADTKVTVLEPLGNLVSREKSPNYSVLKKDGKLTGMMIIGSNLSFGHAGLVDEYLTYYQNAGFEFKEARPLDAISFFKSTVQSGELDYLIKEAHSDGDEKNIFRANKFGKLYEGTLNRKNGSREVIYLLAPDAVKTEGKLISNQEFGGWIRSRGKDQPLVYLNGSCNSTRKVISEIAAAHSANFVPIATSSSVLTFRDDENNGTRQIVDAFRKGKNYDEIRATLQQTANYKKGEDRYIFPDEKDFDEKIRKNLKMNVDIEVSVKDKSGNEIHIDESVDH